MESVGCSSEFFYIDKNAVSSMFLFRQYLRSFQTGLETDVKRLLFLPVVLHVDTGALDALDSAARAQNIR
jgi:hypothetical protein